MKRKRSAPAAAEPKLSQQNCKSGTAATKQTRNAAQTEKQAITTQNKQPLPKHSLRGPTGAFKKRAALQLHAGCEWERCEVDDFVIWATTDNDVNDTGGLQDESCMETVVESATACTEREPASGAAVLDSASEESPDDVSICSSVSVATPKASTNKATLPMPEKAQRKADGSSRAAVVTVARARAAQAAEAAAAAIAEAQAAAAAADAAEEAMANDSSDELTQQQQQAAAELKAADTTDCESEASSSESWSGQTDSVTTAAAVAAAAAKSAKRKRPSSSSSSYLQRQIADFNTRPKHVPAVSSTVATAAAASAEPSPRRAAKSRVATGTSSTSSAVKTAAKASSKRAASTAAPASIESADTVPALSVHAVSEQQCDLDSASTASSDTGAFTSAVECTTAPPAKSSEAVMQADAASAATARLQPLSVAAAAATAAATIDLRSSPKAAVASTVMKGTSCKRIKRETCCTQGILDTRSLALVELDLFHGLRHKHAVAVAAAAAKQAPEQAEVVAARADTKAVAIRAQAEAIAAAEASKLRTLAAQQLLQQQQQLQRQ
jgi:hypothetical protein